jgi:hypothetical protein
VDALLREDRRIASELRAAIAFGKPAPVAIVREPDCKKFCSRRVPKLLMVELKTARINIRAELLQHIE